jgi:hypothetical protein
MPVEQDAQRWPGVPGGVRHEPGDEMQQHHLHRRDAAQAFQVLHLARSHHPGYRAIGLRMPAAPNIPLPNLRP